MCRQSADPASFAFCGDVQRTGRRSEKIALGIDIRGGQDFGGLKDVLDEMDVKEIEYEIRFS